MSRRGIHPFLMGLDKPKRKPVEPLKPNELSGNESAQRKRFIRSQEEATKHGHDEPRNLDLRAR